MTHTATYSPSPWDYEYSPYTLQAAADCESDAVGKEIPAFEVFDDYGNKVFDTNEDTASELQEANARLAAAAPDLLEALKALIDYAENEAYSLEKLKDSPEAEAEAEKAWKSVEAARAAIASAEGRI